VESALAHRVAAAGLTPTPERAGLSRYQPASFGLISVLSYQTGQNRDGLTPQVRLDYAS
jgi:hypothetical protein